jgi:hypothetical protein
VPIGRHSRGDTAVVPRPLVGIPGKQAIGSLLLPRSLMDTFLDQSGIKLGFSGNRILTPVQRESLAKKAAMTFDVNPIVVRIRLDSLFS